MLCVSCSTYTLRYRSIQYTYRCPLFHSPENLAGKQLSRLPVPGRLRAHRLVGRLGHESVEYPHEGLGGSLVGGSIVEDNLEFRSLMRARSLDDN